MISAIYDRRSIRKFLPRPLAESDIIDILQSGIVAPSSKNRQPWKYIVAQGAAKDEALQAFYKGISREEKQTALLPQSRQYLESAKRTVAIMAEAPVIIFVENTLGKNILAEFTPEEHINEICNIQSISAAIENMLLTAVDKGIGGLWIGDIFFAYPELCAWLHSDGQLIAALAFGYPAESPPARPRKKLADVVVWRN